MTGSRYLSATFGASEAMTAFEVRALVEDQIAERWDEINPRGISLRQTLVPPQRMRFTRWFVGDGAVAFTNIDAWLVLEERPKTSDGYKIIYDEQTGKFGLALRGWYSDPYLSVDRFYGDFWSAFNAI
jgi:hypothetical protein